jgi:hypothetical protein
MTKEKSGNEVKVVPVTDRDWQWYVRQVLFEQLDGFEDLLGWDAFLLIRNPEKVLKYCQKKEDLTYAKLVGQIKFPSGRTIDLPADFKCEFLSITPPDPDCEDSSNKVTALFIAYNMEEEQPLVAIAK